MKVWEGGLTLAVFLDQLTWNDPSLKVEGRCLAESNEDKANVLNSVFHDVFTEENGIQLSLPNKALPAKCMNNVEITVENVIGLKSITKLKDKVSHTPQTW